MKVDFCKLKIIQSIPETTYVPSVYILVIFVTCSIGLVEIAEDYPFLLGYQF